LRNYLLDTNICIYALKGHARILHTLLSKSPASIWVSVITEAELRTGAAKSSSPRKSLRALGNFLKPLHIVEFTSQDADAYAQVRAKLEKAGTPIGPMDTLIGAQAISRHLTLVTNNEREFSRISGLSLENWVL
jgi:tRNA(fMet)-specific endonuclease VapC